MLEQAHARTCGPVERGAHTRAGLLAGLVTPRGTHAGIRVPVTCSKCSMCPVHGGDSSVPSPHAALGVPMRLQYWKKWENSD